MKLTTLLSVAIAFFYSSMSVLEGKPEETVERVKAVSILFGDVGCGVP